MEAAQQLVERISPTVVAPPQERQRLSDEHRKINDEFAAWCTTQGVRSFPASPIHLGAYLATRDNGSLRDIVAAISAIHSLVNLADPTATPAVRQVLASRLRNEYPRSWSNADKLIFAGLDPAIQAIILRREKERDKEIRQKQNALALLRKQETPRGVVVELRKRLNGQQKGLTP